MKHDRGTAPDAAGRPLERQLERLAPQLRERGIAPERDLWPRIEAQIARREPGGGRGGLRIWRVAALAASLLLIVGVGWLQWQGPGAIDAPTGPRAERSLGPVPDAAPDVTAAEPVDRLASARDLVDDALDKLNEARRQEPDNAGLTRLLVMIQESRGDLIRNAAERLELPGR